MLKTIGQMIREQRERHCTTKDQTARLCGVDTRSVERWEAGDTLPDILSVWAMADEYGISIDEMVGRNQKRIEFAEADRYNKGIN